MRRNKRALSIDQDRSAIERSAIFLDNAGGEVDFVFLGREAEAVELWRGDSDSGIVVFGIPFAP